MDETIISLEIGRPACSLIDLQETDENVTKDLFGNIDVHESMRSFVLIMLIILMLFVLDHKLIDAEERVQRFRCVSGAPSALLSM
jgi:hypothetical protein